MIGLLLAPYFQNRPVSGAIPVGTFSAGGTVRPVPVTNPVSNIRYPTFRSPEVGTSGLTNPGTPGFGLAPTMPTASTTTGSTAPESQIVTGNVHTVTAAPNGDSSATDGGGSDGIAVAGGSIGGSIWLLAGAAIVLVLLLRK